MHNTDKQVIEVRKVKTDRDVEVNKNLKLRSWDTNKVKVILKCFNCNKPRCYFSQSNNDEYEAYVEILQLKMESISLRYSCGDLVFDDDHPVSTFLGQHQAITCESTIEKAYYNIKQRALKLPDIYIHFGEGGSKDFFLGQTGLEERKKTGANKCYPIFIMCLEAGKKVITYPKTKTKFTKNT